MARAGAEVGKLGGLILFDVYGFAYGTSTSITWLDFFQINVDVSCSMLSLYYTYAYEYYAFSIEQHEPNKRILVYSVH